MTQERIVKARKEGNDCQVIKERKIAADDEKDLETDKQNARDATSVSRSKREPRHNEFDEMIPCRLKFVDPVVREMKTTACGAVERVWLVVIAKAGYLAPAAVAAQFDQACTDHDAKPKPPKEPDNKNRRPAFGERPSIQQWAKKDRQKAGLEKLNLPPVTVPDLPDVHDRHVHHPKHGKQNCVGVAAKNNQRQTETNPRENR